MMHPVLLTFVVCATVLWAGVDLYLLRRQAGFVQRHRNRVPADFAGQVSLAEHQKAASYTVARARLGAVRSGVDLLWRLAILLGGLDVVSGAVGSVSPALWGNVLTIGLLAAIGTLIGLPFRIYGDLVIEQRFGFNARTPGLLIADTLKGWAIAAVIGVLLLSGLFWSMQHLSGLWWLYAWLVLVALMLVAPAVYTRVIAPMFNRFEPLPDNEMRRQIEALMARCGFHASGLFTMDASRRSAHGNAYFIGFGRTKRIVLFDTLLKSQTPAEINAVLAHELGHFKYRHTLYGMLRGMMVLFAMLAAVGWLCKQPWLLPDFGFRHASDATSLVAAWFLLETVQPLLSPLSNWISRRHELQADDFARRMVGVEPMVSALTKLSRDNASTLTPDPVFALMTYSHPPVPIRVAHLRLV